MQVKLYVKSAYDLKNVNWRYGDLQPYAIAWIDSSGKCSTKIDVTNGVNPVWNEMFTISLPLTSHLETAILHIDIVQAIGAADMKPLIGSTRLSLGAALNETRSKGKANFSLILERPSGRPQGNLEIQIQFLDSNNIQREPYGQQPRHIPPQPQPQPQAYGQQAQYMQPQLQPQPQPHPQPYRQQAQYMPSQAQPQVQVQPQPWPQPQPYRQQAQYMPSQPQQLQPQPRPQPRPQCQPRQMNQYPIRPGYPTNLPQNVRPALAQQPGNAMMIQNTAAQYRPVVDALCTLAIGVNPSQIGRMFKSVERMIQGPQQANVMVNNTGNVVSGGTNITPGNYQPVQQGYNNTGYDASATSDNAGYNGSNFGDGQFGTDGGYADGQFGMDGSGLGGCDVGAVDMGMFSDDGVELGELDTADY